MSEKVVILIILIAAFLVLVAIDGRRKMKKKDEENEENIFIIKTEEDYQNNIPKIKNINQEKEINIYIDIENEEEKDILNFEENIEILVEKEIKDAANRIINSLKYKNTYDKDEYKVRDKMCGECGERIIGDMYKEANKTDEKYYCEKCAFSIEGPLFIIH